MKRKALLIASAVFAAVMVLTAWIFLSYSSSRTSPAPVASVSPPMLVAAARPTTAPARPVSPSVSLPDSERAALLPSAFGAYLSTVPPAVQQIMLDWTKAQLEGKPFPREKLEAIRAAAKASEIDTPQLLAFVRTTAFLGAADDLPEFAEIIITRAQAELSKYSPPDTTPTSLIGELWTLHELLWAAETDQWGLTPGRIADQRLMELLLPWETRGSGHSQKVSFTYAELLYMQQKWDEAYVAFQNVLEERKVAFEPSQGSNRNIDWELGLCRYYAGKYAEAAPYLRTMANNKGVPEGPMSWPLAVVAFARSGQTELANKTLDEWIAERKPSVAEVAPILAEIEGAGNPSSRTVMAYTRPSPAAQSERVNAVIANVRNQLSDNPRAGATVLYKERSLDTLISLEAFDSAADFALQCINAQPDRTDRAEYFLSVRAQALLGAKKYPEALAAAKSYYNACLIKSTPKAIELVAQALAGAHPDDPGLPKRFKLQQISNGETVILGSISLGEPVLKDIAVNESIFDGDGFEIERNPDAQWLGKANMLLMQDKPAEARAIFEKLKEASNQNFSSLAKVGLARAIKAADGHVHNANAYLKSLETPVIAPPGF